MTNTNLVKSRLRVVLPLIKEASAITKAIVDNARVLLDEDERGELVELAKEIGSCNATIESKLAQFGRMAVGSRRFCVVAPEKTIKT